MATTRSPGGLSTKAIGLGRSMPRPDPTQYHTYFNDFDTYAAGDWTLSKNGGAGTQALAAGPGGTLVMTNSAGATDAMQNQLTVATFDLTDATKPVWFAIRFKADSDTLSTLMFGLHTVKTTALTTAPTDGFWFLKAAGAAGISIVNSSGSTAVTTATGASIVTNTMSDWSFHYSPNDKAGPSLVVFIDDVQVLTQPLTLSAGVPVMPTGNVALSFGQLNSSAVARVTTIDYVLAMKPR